ncbi:Mu-like prophage major head subunit gpT family protein [Methylosinus sp. H3A]|uniref:Mu-like prophage major head subunit gpT family protein n=1 Tax=Methylosinus sp. H3A TaxID=2785786 RepID=UPI0018C280E8|nr:Mu-like prophage major head subunit gpT family protein [Methylosinus sp. H3A]MBG0809857.1 Mu-like prophage major head subunit gpT family protein [Methylosinus sp. H3A]
MPEIITPSVLDAIFQSFNFTFNNAFGAVTPTWNKIAMEVKSTTSASNYGWLGQMPRIREWVGDRVIGSLDSYGYQIRNKTWESTISLKREQIEDDTYGLFSPAVARLGRSVALFPDELCFGLLGKGFTQACYDGQNFFDTNHPVKDENGNDTFVSNVQAGSGAPWFLIDTTQGFMPIIYQLRRAFGFVSKTDPNQSDRVFLANEFVYGTDGRCNVGFGLWQIIYASKQPLNRANFRAARQAMINLKADYGRPLGVKPTLLVCGPTLEQTARDLIKSQYLPVDGSPGVINASGIGMIENTDRDIVDIFMSPWLG